MSLRCGVGVRPSCKTRCGAVRWALHPTCKACARLNCRWIAASVRRCRTHASSAWCNAMRRLTLHMTSQSMHRMWIGISSAVASAHFIASVCIAVCDASACGVTGVSARPALRPAAKPTTRCPLRPCERHCALNRSAQTLTFRAADKPTRLTARRRGRCPVRHVSRIHSDSERVVHTQLTAARYVLLAALSLLAALRLRLKTSAALARLRAQPLSLPQRRVIDAL